MRPHSKRRRAPAHFTEAERFWFHVEKTATCWLWTGARFRWGYGQFALNNDGPHIQAHRYAWQLTHGPIPDGLHVCHNCPDGDNPACVNPDHLFLGTQLENIRDMMAKGRYVGSAGYQNPRCRAGLHDWTPENTRIVQGHRSCRACWNTYMATYHRARRARQRQVQAS